jgi:hypothetical protein
MKRWTTQEIKLVTELYQKYPLKVVASITGIPLAQIEALTTNRKIISGRSGHFRKGQKSWNKGKHIVAIGCQVSWFKTGHLPHNTKPEGYESIRHDKRGVPYYHVKFEGKIHYKHRLMWELSHGPIPQKHCVIFVDGNTMNCTLENLKLIPLAENALRNANRKKAAESLQKLYNRERVRKKYGLPPLTKHYERLTNY